MYLLMHPSKQKPTVCEKDVSGFTTEISVIPSNSVSRSQFNKLPVWRYQLEARAVFRKKKKAPRGAALPGFLTEGLTAGPDYCCEANVV